MKNFIVFSIFLLINFNYCINAMDFINISGDNMELDESGTQIITGNVRLIYENTILNSEKAKFNNSKNILEAFDNVNVQDDNYDLVCNYMITYIDKQHTIAKQNPYIIEKQNKNSKNKDRMLLKADRILKGEIHT